VPFSPETIEGVGGYACNAFVDSLVKPANSKVGDVNSAISARMKMAPCFVLNVIRTSALGVPEVTREAEPQPHTIL